MAADKANGDIEAALAAADAASAEGADGAHEARQQMTKILGIDIPPARCQAHMRASIADPRQAEIKRRMSALRAAAKEAGTAPEANPEFAKLKAENEELNKTTVRLGGEAHFTMAALTDWACKEMIRHSMRQTLAADHKLVEINALHEGDFDRLPAFQLVKNLAPFAEYDAENEAQLKNARAEANRALKRQRDDNKKAGKAGAPAGPAADKQAAGRAANHGAEGAAAGDGASTTFNTYVENATKAVKREEGFEVTRVSDRFRKVLAEICAALVARLTALTAEGINGFLKVRTLNSEHLLVITKILLFNAGCGPNDFAPIQAYADEVLQRHRAHVDAEKARKENSKTDADRAAEEEKKAAAETKKKAERAEAAMKRARELVQLSKELKAEAVTAGPTKA